MNTMIDEANLRWNEMRTSVNGLNLELSCEAPCNANFVSNCIALCFLGLESPFPEGSELDCAWQDMMYFYRRWRDYKGQAGCAYKKRFVRFAVKLIKECPRSPFENEMPVSVEWLKEVALEAAEIEDAANETYVPVVAPEQSDKEVEKVWQEMNGLKSVETVTEEPPRKFFNIFKRRGRKV